MRARRAAAVMSSRQMRIDYLLGREGHDITLVAGLPDELDTVIYIYNYTTSVNLKLSVCHESLNLKCVKERIVLKRLN